MCMRLWIGLTLLLSGIWTLAAIAGGHSSDAAMIAGLKAGGHILMIRHALAPGTGDPAHFQIGDCSTQRNLDDRGRQQASTIGNWLRNKGITSARVYSSQWCRCLETAELLRMGPVTELPALNSFYELTQNRESNLKALNHFMAKQPQDGALIIMVTHLVTISAIADVMVLSGEGVLLKLNQQGTYKMIDRLNFDIQP